MSAFERTLKQHLVSYRIVTPNFQLFFLRKFFIHKVLAVNKRRRLDQNSPHSSTDDVLFRSTYETAPVFSLMEKVVLRKMRQYISWTGEDGDGILAPGLYTLDDSDVISCQLVSAAII